MTYQSNLALCNRKKLLQKPEVEVIIIPPTNDDNGFR